MWRLYDMRAFRQYIHPRLHVNYKHDFMQTCYRNGKLPYVVLQLISVFMIKLSDDTSVRAS